MPNRSTKPKATVPQAPRALFWKLWLAGLTSLAIYLFLPAILGGLSQSEPSFAARVFGWSGFFSNTTLHALRESTSHIRASVEFVLLTAGLFTLYTWVLKLVRDHQSPGAQKIILCWGSAFLLIQIFTPMLLSSDVYAYALYGRVVSVYHANPYDLAPPVAPNDPFLKLFGQEYLPSWYGPLWTLISTGITRLCGNQIGLTVLAFRLTAIFAAIGCALLVLASLRRHAPARATQGLAFILWNPLFILETGLSGHNDSVMLFFVILAAWLHLRGWKTAAVAALTLSALVKFLTGMLIPLYLLLVLLEMTVENGTGNLFHFLRELFVVNWRRKALFLTRSGLLIALICFGASALKKSDAGQPVARQAIAPDFYANNFHELIFKGIRRMLGEDKDSVNSPIYFQGWWLVATNSDHLLARPDPRSDHIAALATGAAVVVTMPQTDDNWARVYDPASKLRGFVWSPRFADAERPTNADAVSKLYDTMTADRPTVILANNLLRALLWIAFAAFGLFCAWRTGSTEEFFAWSAAALLASYFLILTEIWPWYANWAVAVGALAGHRSPARLAAILSACVLTLYITLGFRGSEHEWIYDLRSIPAFVLPLLVWFVLKFRRANRHATC